MKLESNESIENLNSKESLKNTIEKLKSNISDLESKTNLLTKDECVKLGYLKGQAFVLEIILDSLF